MKHIMSLKLTFLCVLVSMASGVVINAIRPTSALQEQNNQAAVAQCPDGQTLQGFDDSNNPICRAYPTGCPYGDSIPLDSPKCAPTTPEEKAAVGTQEKQQDIQEHDAPFQQQEHICR